MQVTFWVTSHQRYKQVAFLEATTNLWTHLTNRPRSVFKPVPSVNTYLCMHPPNQGGPVRSHIRSESLTWLCHFSPPEEAGKHLCQFK